MWPQKARNRYDENSVLQVIQGDKKVLHSFQDGPDPVNSTNCIGLNFKFAGLHLSTMMVHRKIPRASNFKNDEIHD